LEDEAVGPTAGNLVAQNLTDLLDQTPDPVAEIRLGRYVKADGTLTDAYSAPQDQGAPGHFPTDAVAVWLTDPGSAALEPDSGTIVALGDIVRFGDRPVDANGAFMDFDGAEEPNGSDVSTRGMLVRAPGGGIQKRYYVDVYPAVAVEGSLGPAIQRGYPRPKGATPLYASLTPAYQPCASPNRQHGPPLAFGSCNPPQPTSSQLTVGTPDSNAQRANSIGFIRYDVVVGDPSTPANDADVRVTASITDVRRQGSLADYTGELGAEQLVQITDRLNGTSQNEPATTQTSPFRFAVPCAATGDTSIGASCSLSSTFNAVVPGSVVESKRAIWQLGKVEVFDGGADGQAATTNDNTLFERQGIFVP
jgi:hypothetical protein